MASRKENQRVVVTGVGVVSPYDVGTDAFRQGAMNSLPCIASLRSLGSDGLKCQIGAEVRDLIPDQLGTYAHPPTRSAALAYPAAREALASLKDHTGVEVDLISSIGWGWPAMDVQGEPLALAVKSGSIWHWMDSADAQPGAGESWLAKELNEFLRPHAASLSGYRMNCLSACAASTQAIGMAFQRIRRGDAQRVLCGGADSRVNPLGMLGYERLGALTTDYNDRPIEASRPFDKDRSGFVPGEGAAFLLLESLESAQARGASIMAEIIGAAWNTDGYRLTDPEPEGRVAAACLEACLKDARLSVQEAVFSGVAYIAHGTGTPANDLAEAKALKTLFGNYLTRVPVAAWKSLFGHWSMAAGAAEISLAVLCLQEGRLAPTLNHWELDPEIAQSTPMWIPRAQEKKTFLAPGALLLKGSFGFGGQNAALLMKGFSPS